MLDRKVVNIKNGVQALLVSDPKANKTSIALDIKVGSMNDPKDAQGLSHLLEHMLFKGSARYPDGNFLSSLLYSNQGVYSAATGAEHSSFTFEVSNDSFKQTLEVFSNFFKNPLLRKKDIGGEVYLIDNEFSLNKKDPDSLCRHLLNATSIEGHPVSKFFHGNAKTLKNVDEQNLRTFFDSYITAPKKVVVCGRYSLVELEEMVLKNFSSLQNTISSPESFSGPVFNSSKTPDVIYVEYLGGKPFLRLCFETQSIYKFFKSKPNWIISSLVNSERTGSVIALLRKKGLAEELWTSFQNLSFTSFVNIDVMLTPKGLLKPFDVSNYIFSCLELLRQKGCRDYVYNEQKSTAEAGFKFKEHREGLLYVRGLARNMHYYNAGSCDEQSELIYEYSNEDFENVLESMRSKSSRTIIYGAECKLDSKDKYYGAKFKYSESLKLKPLKKVMGITYPQPNVFIPQNFSHVKDDSVHYPHKILDDVRGTVWFMKDRELGLPYIYINLLILSPCVNKDPKEKLKSIVYSKVLSESLRDVADMAGEAGLTFGVERNDRGIATYFAGYSDKMFVLFKNVLDALSCDLKDNDLLNKIKRSLKSDYLELEQGTSYAVATYYKYDLMHKNNINYSKYIKMIDGVTLKDVNLTRKNIFKRFAVESYVYGNLNATDAEKIVDDLFNKFNPEKLDIAERPKDFIIKNPRGSRNSYALKCKAADSCWTSYFDFGHRHIRLSAVIQLGFGFLKGFFFDQMRNKKKLGYVVESRLDFFEHVLGISFTVCSEFFDTFLISTQAKKVFNDFIAYLDSLSEQELESSRNSLIAGISKNNRTIEEWMSEIVLTAAVKGDPDYGKKLCAEIATVTRQELIEVFYSNLCGSDSTSISVYANGTNSKHKKDLKKGIKDTGELFMDDVFQFKDGATFYQ